MCGGYQISIAYCLFSFLLVILFSDVLIFLFLKGGDICFFFCRKTILVMVAFIEICDCLWTTETLLNIIILFICHDVK